MDNNVLHDLLISINEFILTEKNRPVILDIVDRVDYYMLIVTEYYYLSNQLSRLLITLTDPPLLSTVTLYMDELVLSFDSYKNELLIQEALIIVNSNTERIEFFDKLIKFEKSLTSSPVIKVDEAVIQDIIESATVFSEKKSKLYYFENNPFKIDPVYNVVIPVKKVFSTTELFLSNLYSYLFGIYTTYNYKNSEAIHLMKPTEIEITHRLNEFQNYILGLKNKRLELTGTSLEYYTAINLLITSIETYKAGLMNLSVYRYYTLNIAFNTLVNKSNNLINSFKDTALYAEEADKLEYAKKLIEFGDNIKLLEKGVVLVDKDYMIDSESTFQSLVSDIIEYSERLKVDITYTEQYSNTGDKADLRFAFYQTSDFFTRIKAYYYKLMTIDVFAFNTIRIEDFGDDTTIVLRHNYTVNYGKYNKFVTQSTEYMTLFELREFITQVEMMQTLLKEVAVAFFANAFETSPVTFATAIELEYSQFKERLDTDLIDIKKKHILNLDSNPIRQDALVILNKSITYYDRLVELMKDSTNYVMLGNIQFINANLYNLFNDYKSDVFDTFNKEDYSGVILQQDNFYKTSTLNHNLFIVLSRLTNNIVNIFDHYNNAQNLFVSSQIQSTPTVHDNEAIKYIVALFEGGMLSAVRQEVVINLDNLYLYIIDKNKNLKQFYLNEKNLKINYFDNATIKANYIRLYNKVLSVYTQYSDELQAISTNNEYTPTHIINAFDYIKQLETLIMHQNNTLSSLAKIIKEQYIDTNYNVDTILETAISSIYAFNDIIEPDIALFESELLKYREIQKNKLLHDEYRKVTAKHSQTWKDITNKNIINSIKPVSYNELDTIHGTVPFAIELSADYDLVTEETPMFTWEINGEILTGKEVAYTIYVEGITKVICSRIYPSGETTVRYIEFDIAGPTNSQVVKSTNVVYAPITDYINQTMITIFDPTTNTQVTIPINVNGNIEEMLADGNISVSESTSDLLIDKTGLVVVGFEGVEIAGAQFDYKQIFAEDFEMPEEANFLFDFNVSDPVAGKSVIDITKSTFITAIAKVPSSKVSSVYDISDVSEFQLQGGNTLPVIVGDLIIMKNKSNRYALVEIISINSVTNVELGQYNFEIEFKVHVNVSLNPFEQTNFKPLTTDYVVPTILFETNSIELFSSLIERIKKINTLQLSMEETIDTEKKILFAEEINDIKFINNQFYLVSEYNKLSAHVNILQEKLDSFNIVVDYKSIGTKSISIANMRFKQQLDSTKTFAESMNSTKMYDFRNNIVDLSIIVSLYKEEQKMLAIILGTFDYMDKDLEHFLMIFDSCSFIDPVLVDKIQYEGLTYIKQLPLIVSNARTHLYRLKLVINLPILIAGKYIIPSTSFNRLAYSSDGTQHTIDDIDFYLLNKKIELAYGYEVAKSQIPDNNLISNITKLVKEVQGSGLSDDDKTNIGTYIEEVERRVVIEYDDFFMLPLWMDYLTKLM